VKIGKPENPINRKTENLKETNQIKTGKKYLKPS
jgi:hypothetical protein